MAELVRTLELLEAMAAAYEVPHPNTHGREPLLFVQYMGGQHIQHHAFEGEKWGDVDEQMLEDLHSQGLIRLDYGNSGSIQVHVTRDGAKVAAEARRMLAGKTAVDPEAVDLDWESVGEPTLRAAYETWRARGASHDGVLAAEIVDEVEGVSELSAYRAITMLVDADYLAQAGLLSSEHGPALVRVTSKGLQAVGGWPATTADAAAKALLAALDQQIEEAEGEEKTKLERLREMATDVGQGVLTDLMRRVILGEL